MYIVCVSLAICVSFYKLLLIALVLAFEHKATLTAESGLKTIKVKVRSSLRHLQF